MSREVRRWFRPPRRLRFTREGKYYVLCTIGIGFGAINTGNNLLYLLLGWMLSLIIASGILSEIALRRITVARRPPSQIFAGRPFLLGVSLENLKRWLPSFCLVVRDRESGRELDGSCFFLKVQARRSETTSYRQTYARRGSRSCGRIW